MSVRISLPYALLASLALHVVLLADLRPPAKPLPEAPPLRVELPAPDTEAAAQLSTTDSPAVEPPPPAAIPVMARGRQLAKAQAMLSRQLFYPPEAVAAGLEGEALLLLLLEPDGRVRSAEIARSSGHTILDRAAIDAARRIGALPGNPPQTLLPIRFQLQ